MNLIIFPTFFMTQIGGVMSYIEVLNLSEVVWDEREGYSFNLLRVSIQYDQHQFLKMLPFSSIHYWLLYKKKNHGVC